MLDPAPSNNGVVKETPPEFFCVVRHTIEMIMIKTPTTAMAIQSGKAKAHRF